MTSTDDNTTPVWLLDIDGVINVDESGWPCPLSTGSARTTHRSFTIRWCPQLIDEIRDMHTRGIVEIRWATTWIPFIDEIHALLDLPKIATAFDVDPRTRGSAVARAKLVAATSVVHDGRPLIWTDNDAIPYVGTSAHTFLMHTNRTLLIRPRPHTGLLHKHISLIKQFAERRGESLIGGETSQ